MKLNCNLKCEIIRPFALFCVVYGWNYLDFLFLNSFGFSILSELSLLCAFSFSKSLLLIIRQCIGGSIVWIDIIFLGSINLRRSRWTDRFARWLADRKFSIFFNNKTWHRYFDLFDFRFRFFFFRFTLFRNFSFWFIAIIVIGFDKDFSFLVITI